jgi:BlaI family penicillinase repressor
MEEPASDVSLSELQLQVMRVLWSRQASTVAEVVEAMRDTRPLAHTTVATVLSRLEKRELVVSWRDGRQLVFRALASEEQVQRSMVSGLVSNLFAGNAGALMSYLVRSQDVGSDDLAKIRAMLASKGDGND